jgi:hypothetical protein
MRVITNSIVKFLCHNLEPLQNQQETAHIYHNHIFQLEPQNLTSSDTNIRAFCGRVDCLHNSVADPWHLNPDADLYLWLTDPGGPKTYSPTDLDPEHSYIYIILQKKSQNSRNLDFSYYFCLMMEGSGARSGTWICTVLCCLFTETKWSGHNEMSSILADQ